MLNDNNFDSYLANERARHTGEHALSSLISELSVLLLTTTLMWNIFDSLKLLLWLFISILISLTAFWAHVNLQPEKLHYSVARWTIASISTSFLVGFSWAMMPVLFFAYDNVWYISIMVAIYTGYVSGALAVSVTFMPGLLAFVLGITIPFAGAMFFRQGDLYLAIGGLSIFYVTAILYVSQGSSKLFVESIRRQYENENLLAELAREKDAVEQAVTAKDRFLASASHDLRQPLNAIRLFVEALEPIQKEPLGNQIVDKLRQSLKALNGMLHSLLDISRLDAKVIDNEPKHLNLSTLVAQLCDEYQEKAPHLEIGSDIETNITVYADTNILHRIIRNLVDNAVKYTPAGRVNVNAHPQGQNKFLLTIEDTGIGIPKDKLTLVFDEYEQLGNRERNREKGLGLGLSIVRRLCSIAEIDIELSSELGVGTKVTLTLLQGSLQQHERIEIMPDSSIAGKLVLVIDDEPDILVAMQHLLSSWSCNVIAADSTKDALEKLSEQSHVPDFIVSDLRLRDGEEGDELIAVVRNQYKQDIPAILVTGDTAPKRITRINESGLSVIYKPLEPDDLFRELTRLNR